jgi:hypothetical protein
MNTSTEDLLTEDLFGYKAVTCSLVMVQANIFTKINLVKNAMELEKY